MGEGRGVDGDGGACRGRIVARTVDIQHAGVDVESRADAGGEASGKRPSAHHAPRGVDAGVVERDGFGRILGEIDGSAEAQLHHPAFGVEAHGLQARVGESGVDAGVVHGREVGVGNVSRTYLYGVG